MLKMRSKSISNSFSLPKTSKLYYSNMNRFKKQYYCTKSNEEYPLIKACEDCSVSRVSELLKDPTINVNETVEYSKWTPLHISCIQGNTEIFDLLIKHPNIDVNAKNLIRVTPLHLVCKTRNNYFADKLLEFPELNLNVINGDNMRPIHLAILQESEYIFCQLVKYDRLDVNTEMGMGGGDVLSQTLRSGTVSMLKSLLMRKDLPDISLAKAEKWIKDNGQIDNEKRSKLDLYSRFKENPSEFRR
eukprot:gb/GECH01006727.1/.p1 GENE.gb/GECH01006727.1/~~gb/GECH01006727.1/.p1  ORF type:complete len:245 (+),score=49.58 gb/GECH01006727.1/:1-735(+)